MSDGGFSWETVFGAPFMTPQDVRKANIALDIMIQKAKEDNQGQ